MPKITVDLPIVDSVALEFAAKESGLTPEAELIRILHENVERRQVLYRPIGKPFEESTDEEPEDFSPDARFLGADDSRVIFHEQEG